MGSDTTGCPLLNEYGGVYTNFLIITTAIKGNVIIVIRNAVPIILLFVLISNELFFRLLKVAFWMVVLQVAASPAPV